jgi:hypothetical protein
MSLEENKKIAEADVWYSESGEIEEKLSYYDDNPATWDPLIMAMKYSTTTSTVSGFEEVKKFYTWLARLPPVRVIIQRVFGEGDHVAVNASEFVKNRYSIGGIGVEGEGSRSLSSRSQWVVPKLIQLRKEGRNGT